MVRVGVGGPSSACRRELKRLAIRTKGEDATATDGNPAIEGIPPAAPEPGLEVVERVECERELEAVQSPVEHLPLELVAVRDVRGIAATRTGWAVVVAAAAGAIRFEKAGIAVTETVGNRVGVVRAYELPELLGAPADRAAVKRWSAKASILRVPESVSASDELIREGARRWENSDLGHQRQFRRSGSAGRFGGRVADCAGRKAVDAQTAFVAATRRGVDQDPYIGARLRDFREVRVGRSRQESYQTGAGQTRPSARGCRTNAHLRLPNAGNNPGAAPAPSLLAGDA